MINRKIFAAMMAAGLISIPMFRGAIAAPITLNFDNIAPLDEPTADTSVPTNYGGFDWTAATAARIPFTIHNDVFTGSQSVDESFYENTYKSPSGNYALMGNTAFSISRKDGFVVSSIFATSLSVTNQESTGSAKTLIFRGFKNGQETGSREFSLSFDRYDRFDLSSLGAIDTLTFEATGTQRVGRYFLIDDLTFDTAAAAPVPVPAAVWLLGSGMGLMFAGRRRKAA